MTRDEAKAEILRLEGSLPRMKVWAERGEFGIERVGRFPRSILVLGIEERLRRLRAILRPVKGAEG